MPKLLATPAAVRFLSLEPLLGPVNLIARCPPHYAPHLRHDRIAWVIVGGESSQPGHPARPFDIAWACSTVAQCKAAGVPVFVKQMGSAPEWNCHDEDAEPPYWGALKYRDRAGADPAEWPADLRVQEFPR